MTNTATAAAGTTTAARYSESLHVLVDVPMRSVILGLAMDEADRTGGRPREGEMIRSLLEEAVGKLARRDREKYDAALARGRAEIAARAEERDRRAAARRPGA